MSGCDSCVAIPSLDRAAPHPREHVMDFLEAVALISLVSCIARMKCLRIKDVVGFLQVFTPVFVVCFYLALG